MTLEQQTHQQSLQTITNWKLEGRLGFKSAEESFSASMNWQQSPNTYQMRLSNLVGMTLLNIDGNSHEVSIEVDDNTYRHSDPQELIYELTQWDIPVSSLGYWIKGQLLEEQMTAVEYENGLLTRFEQAGWQVSLQKYRPVNDVWLPHELVLNNQRTQLKIRVKRWKIS